MPRVGLWVVPGREGRAHWRMLFGGNACGLDVVRSVADSLGTCLWVV